MPLSPRLEGWKAGVMTDRWTGPRWETSGLGGHSCSPGKEERSGGAENRAFFQGGHQEGRRGGGRERSGWETLGLSFGAPFW